MNKRPFFILSAFLLLFSLIEKGQATETYRPETSVAGFIQLSGSGRQVYNFNPGWRFFRGDVRGAEAVNFDDRSWNVVSTPHTVELMPAEGSGCRNYQGPAWYRKHLSLIHILMQQQTNANLWGTATPHKKVTVTTSWNGKQYAATADKNGA